MNPLDKRFNIFPEEGFVDLLFQRMISWTEIIYLFYWDIIDI